jgi:hypothetical protein
MLSLLKNLKPILMNPILEEILVSRNGHYCHVVEVNDKFELMAVVGSIVEEYQDRYDMSVISEFLNSLTVYCLVEDNEDEVYDMVIDDLIEEMAF